jgi:diketogulonate reductase-like aldo/keto reductase
MSVPLITLNDGNKIPALGLGQSVPIISTSAWSTLTIELRITWDFCGSLFGVGTWQFKPEEGVNAVAHALKNGYKHLDGAW